MKYVFVIYVKILRIRKYTSRINSKEKENTRTYKRFLFTLIRLHMRNRYSYKKNRASYNGQTTELARDYFKADTIVFETEIVLLPRHDDDNLRFQRFVDCHGEIKQRLLIIPDRVHVHNTWRYFRYVSPRTYILWTIHAGNPCTSNSIFVIPSSLRKTRSPVVLRESRSIRFICSDIKRVDHLV